MFYIWPLFFLLLARYKHYSSPTLLSLAADSCIILLTPQTILLYGSHTAMVRVFNSIYLYRRPKRTILLYIIYDLSCKYHLRPFHVYNIYMYIYILIRNKSLSYTRTETMNTGVFMLFMYIHV